MISGSKIRRNKKLYYLLITLLGIVFVFLLWWVLSLVINNSLFPSPRKTFLTLFSLLSSSSLYASLGGTLLRLVLSFLLSFVISLLIGILAGIFKKVSLFLNPLIITMRTIPTAALILVLIVLLKPPFALFIIVFLIMFPVMYEAVLSGINNIDESVISALKLDSSLTSFKVIFKVLLPMSESYIRLGMIQALGLGMKVSLMTEILIGDSSLPGLGILIRRYYNFAEMDGVFAVSLIAIVLIGLTDFLFKKVKMLIK